MRIGRILTHLFTTAWSVRRAFPPRLLDRIEQTVRDCEATHAGQIRFAVEHSLDLPELLRGESARRRAIDVFSTLRVWDTEQNNGVLIYLLLADHDVEIVADRGIHVRVGPEGWEAICQQMESAFRQGDFEGGVLAGIHAVSEHLRRHYPARGLQPDELSNRPAVL
jgi:uncharacterized membrane protein